VTREPGISMSGSDKSNVMKLVQQLKTGQMSKEDVLQQLRRIQLEKRSSSSRISATSSHSDDSKYNNEQTTPEDLYPDSVSAFDQTLPLQTTTMETHDPFQHQSRSSSHLQNTRDSSTRSWVEEEATLLADEEEACPASRVHTALQQIL
jgi:hypothetical protein